MKKINTYICSGCEISNCIDLSALVAVAESSGPVQIVENLCSTEGITQLKKSRSDAEAIAIAACSPRQKTEEFQLATLTERIDLRELVCWSQPAGEEDTQMLAEDQLRMGLAKLQAILNPAAYKPENISQEILVLGGGWSGMITSLQIAKAGYKVHLVEKTEKLGGKANSLYKRFPFDTPFKELNDVYLEEKTAHVQDHENITIHVNSTLEAVSGQPGEFKAALNSGIVNRDSVINIGAIVVTTGWSPYDPAKLTHIPYQDFEGIYTNLEFEEGIKDRSISSIQSILFLQCAGSRDKEHLPYCSNYCCATSLKQIKYVREKNPDALIYVLYRDIRTPGKMEAFYKDVQNDAGVFFVKGELKEMKTDGGEIITTIHESSFGREVSIKTTNAVLAMGMRPNSTDELNLTYRQGKGLPELKYGFPDSHFICYPYETRRTGIYAAGTVRAPMDMTTAAEDASGAALKAIQCIEMIKRGESVHPRSGDLSYPELYLQRCTDCKRCTEECPFGSYDETEKGTPLPHPTRCRRCGICLGACPERIINFENFSIQSVSEMIKAVHVPDEFDEKPRILVFLCENDAYPALDMAAYKRLEISPWVRIIPVRCLGSINKVWISDALSKGFDGILQIGCKGGDDYQCHFMHGSDLTETRGENVSETLEKMMLEPERIRTERVEINDFHGIVKIINDYSEMIEDLGPNPFKEM